MRDIERVKVQILADADDDDEELALLTRRLRSALLDLDVAGVDPETREAPGSAKGGLAVVLGWLWVNIGGEALKAVLDRIGDWAASNGRAVEVTVNGNTLKLSRVSREQQHELIGAWLAHLPAEGPAEGPEGPGDGAQDHDAQG